MNPARLRTIPLFESMTDDELHAISPFAEERSVGAGETLVQEGQYSYEFLAIQEGEAEVTRDGEHVADLGPGDFFGEVGLLEKSLRTATVTAKTEMRVISLTGWDLKRIEKRLPEAFEKIRAVLDQRKAPADG